MTKKKKIIIIFFITLLAILAYFGFSLASKLLKVFGSADPVNNIIPVSDGLTLEQLDNFGEIKNPDQSFGDNDFSGVISGIMIDKELLNKKRESLFIEEEKGSEISSSTGAKREGAEIIATSSLEKEEDSVVSDKTEESEPINDKTEDIVNNEISASSSDPDLSKLSPVVIDESASSSEVLE
jgi:hypothetical protein